MDFVLVFFHRKIYCWATNGYLTERNNVHVDAKNEMQSCGSINRPCQAQKKPEKYQNKRMQKKTTTKYVAHSVTTRTSNTNHHSHNTL